MRLNAKRGTFLTQWFSHTALSWDYLHWLCLSDLSDRAWNTLFNRSIAWKYKLINSNLILIGVHEILLNVLLNHTCSLNTHTRTIVVDNALHSTMYVRNIKTRFKDRITLLKVQSNANKIHDETYTKTKEERVNKSLTGEYWGRKCLFCPEMLPRGTKNPSDRF